MAKMVWKEYQPMSNLYVDGTGKLHCDAWFIIEGVGGIDLDYVVYSVYFLTYCI